MNNENLNVLMLNGSPRAKGCTFTALSEIGKVLNENGIDYEIFQIGSGPIRDCIACGKCHGNGCVFEDDGVNEFIEKAKKANGFVFGTPVYYAHPTGSVLSFLDRAFFSSSANRIYKAFINKPGVAIASARRAGTTATLDVMNKYFGIASMPVVSSTYWNMVHGKTPEEVKKDFEGMQTMRNIGRNLSKLIKIFRNANVEEVNLEVLHKTNFINN